MAACCGGRETICKRWGKEETCSFRLAHFNIICWTRGHGINGLCTPPLTHTFTLPSHSLTYTDATQSLAFSAIQSNLNMAHDKKYLALNAFHIVIFVSDSNS